MTSDQRVDVALRALGELPVPEAPPQEEARRRRLVVEQLERMQREGARVVPTRRGWRWGAGALGLAAVAAAVLIVTTGVFRSAGPASVVPQAQTEVSERPIATGSEVKTEAGSTVQLKTALGAKISVAPASELRLAGGDGTSVVERVDLSRGSIQVKVPKLGTQRQFRVSTPDTLVIVHGTEFRVTVERDAAGQPNTVVEVTSGRVEVRRKHAVAFLNAGAAWSSLAGVAGVKTAQAEAVPVASAPVRAAASASVPKPAANTADAPRGTLAQANALLASALEASRKGNDKLALARLDELLRRYPDSPVADNARVERFRTLRRLGRAEEASRAATKYLKGDPDGFARDEARELGK